MTELTHPERVAKKVEPKCRVLALLHDAIEDGHITDVDSMGGLASINIHALRFVSRKPDEEYFRYIARMIEGLDDHIPGMQEAARRACVVKLADLDDNMYGRETPPNPELMGRYKKATAMLNRALGAH